MIPVEEAIKLISHNVGITNTENISLKQCLGRVLSKNVASKISNPPFDSSAMDGYALKASDTKNAPVNLKQIGVSQAGAGFNDTVKFGETVRIFTGAPLPEGTDAVQIQENTKVRGNQIKILKSVNKYNFVRPIGLDFSKGDILIKAGTVLTARHIGLAAAMNLSALPVSRKPKVGIIATGDEIAMPGSELKNYEIIGSNSFGLHGYIISMGGEPVDLGISGDTIEQLNDSLKASIECDILVTTGGVSVGDYDLVLKSLVERGLKKIFHKIAMRPGKPLLFGKINNLVVFGMPGNPVSVGVCSFLFLRTALYKMLGIKNKNISKQIAVLAKDLDKNDVREDYLRGKLETNHKGEKIVIPLSKQESSMQAGFANADCLIIRLANAPSVKAGKQVEIINLRDSLLSF